MKIVFIKKGVQKLVSTGKDRQLNYVKLHQATDFPWWPFMYLIGSGIVSRISTYDQVFIC